MRRMVRGFLRGRFGQRWCGALGLAEGDTPQIAGFAALGNPPLTSHDLVSFADNLTLSAQGYPVRCLAIRRLRNGLKCPA